MYPVVIGNGRNLQSDAIINGFHVPKGVSSSSKENCSYKHYYSWYYNHWENCQQTHVIFPHLVVSNLEEYFPEPSRFIPERWIKRDTEIGESNTNK